jgi:hypothetical protein
MMNWITLTILALLAGPTLAQTEPAAKKKPPVKQEQKKEEAAKPAPAPVAVVKPAPPETSCHQVLDEYVGKWSC